MGKTFFLAGFLQKKLGLIAHAATKKALTPVYQCVLVSYSSGRLEFKAFEQRTSTLTVFGYDCSSDVVYGDAVSVALPSQALSLINQIDSEEFVLFSFDKNTETLFLKWENNEYSLSAFAGDFFVTPPELEKVPECVVSLPLSDLMRMVDFVSHTVSTDDIRPVLTGYFFEVLPDETRVTTTNSFILSSVSIPGNGYDCSFSAILSPSVVLSLKKSLSDCLSFDPPATLIFYKNVVSIKCMHAVVSSPYLAGEYPPYRGLSRESYAFSFSVDASRLHSTLKRVKSLIFEKNIDAVSLSVSPDVLTVSFDLQESRGVEVLPINLTSGDLDFDPPFSFSLSLRYFMPLLESYKNKTVTFFIESARHMIMLNPDDRAVPDYSKYSYIMPIF